MAIWMRNWKHVRDLTHSIAVLAFAALGTSLIASSTSYAQNFPSKVIKFVLPLSAGSPIDVIARIVAPALSSRLKQSVIVENRPGGGTTVGTRAVATAEPDGYTLLFASATHTLGPALIRNPGYDPIKDFAPIATIGSGSWVLVVIPPVPAQSVQELIAHAKANPGKLNWGFGRNGPAFAWRTMALDRWTARRRGATLEWDLRSRRSRRRVGEPVRLLASAVDPSDLRPSGIQSPSSRLLDDRRPRDPGEIREDDQSVRRAKTG